MICAVVLAAGESRRMGCQKLLLPYGPTTVIEHIVDQLLDSAVEEVLVVVGHGADEVEAALAGRPVTTVAHPEYRAGMLSSVRCGLRALPSSGRAVLVALGDQPSITHDLVDKMVRAFDETTKPIVVPLYRGGRGHPLLFSMRFGDEILTRYDEVGLRGLLHAHPDEVFELAVSTPAALSDMDTPEDYAREMAQFDKEGQQ